MGKVDPRAKLDRHVNRGLAVGPASEESVIQPRISFVMPMAAAIPIGGFKVLYEYANGLAARNWQCSVICPYAPVWEPMPSPSREPFKYLRRRAGHAWRTLHGRHRPDSWFRADPRVEFRCLFTLRQRGIPNADFIVASDRVTAKFVSTCPSRAGKKAYLVQAYEQYMAGPDRVRREMEESFLFPWDALMGISPAAVDLIRQRAGKSAKLIPNGIDHNKYYLVNPIESPGRRLLGFPWREEEFKGTGDAVAALEAIPGMRSGQVWTFGRAPRPPGVPEWITYHHLPTDDRLRELYNGTKIFLVPSRFEGWGLPGSEAMACGAALVSVDNGGVRAYARSEVSAVLVPPGSADALASAVRRMLGDDELRRRIARAGNSDIRSFTWSRAVDTFESVLLAT